MKNPTRFYGILLLILGFLLCVVNAFVPGTIFILIGLFMAAVGQPKETADKKTTTQTRQRTPAPIKPPVLVPGAPAEDAYAFRGSVDDYFAAMLRGCFPEYAVEQNVPVSALSQKSLPISAWECSCGAANTGKFCSECGKVKPEPKDWNCTCGAKNTGKFCSECGSVRPIVTVSVNNYTPVDDMVNISFLLRKNGTAKAAILLCDKNRWNVYAIRNTIGACEKAGIPCLRFIRQFRNRGDYVVDRIKDTLR